MAVDNNSLRAPRSIGSLSELEAAKKKAAINASQDRLLLTNNLGKIKEGGPAVLLQNVVLPVAAVGFGLWVASKAIKSIFSPDDGPAAAAPHAGAPAYAMPPPTAATSRRPATAHRLTAYLPVALEVAKMGVGYLEKNGTAVPPLVHALLGRPGVSPERSR